MHNPCWFDLVSDIFFNQHFRDMISFGIKRENNETDMIEQCVGLALGGRHAVVSAHA